MQGVKPIRNPATIKQMEAYLSRRSMRDWMLFAIGIRSGLHLHDLLHLRVGDLFGKNEIKVNESKTGKEKRFTLDDHMKMMIEQYCRNLNLDAEHYLFSSKRTGTPIKRVRVYRILNEAAKEVGLSDIGTHTMRKTFGYHFYKRTGDIRLLKEYFNHSAPSVTLRYIGAGLEAE
ncbi:tyrosine-type recombinase/integrase [Paenibacillus glycinis]|uniref:Tyrosine-type recombinase/integrase n=1 Tax=Paenibacillus glycinis TaxID=2697035 RepID=A0ABW9XM30_9BACL|nr:tyrosine-type recombinase/integrase [Paenibacillus glycinis]NBD23616.1 tyrosine-type recombinase/integrase [Paenibacillus glycinis]